MMMWKVHRFAGLVILVCFIVSYPQSTVLAAPQATKTQPTKSGSSKAAVPKSADPKAKGTEPPAELKPGSSEPNGQQGTDAKNEEGKKPARRMSRAEKKEAAITEARAGVKEMIRKLGKGEYLEFMHQHIPIDEYVRRLRSGQPVELPLQAIPELIQMANTLQSLQDGDATIDPTGRVVTFTAKEDVKVAKAIENPYSKEADEAAAYEGDLPEVIAAALKDLKAKKYEACLSRVLPPSTIQMMKTDGRWEGMMKSLTSDSPMITAMITDLEVLSKGEASIDGETAEYRLPRVFHLNGRGDDAEEEEAGERLIRFSKINGSWRFFDSNAKTSEVLDATLKREPTGEISEDQLVVEKIGSDWRLLQIPGMPPVRPLE